MKLIIFRNAIFETVEINEGCCYLLSQGIPHRPTREENSIGIVIESSRRSSENGMFKMHFYLTFKADIDSLIWFCPHCNSIIYKVDFKINRIDKDIEAAISSFEQKNEPIKCINCSKIVSLKEFSNCRLPGD